MHGDNNRLMGIYQQPTDKFKCFMCRKLQTNSCPVCNKQTNQSWEIALNMGKKNEKEKQK